MGMVVTRPAAADNIVPVLESEIAVYSLPHIVLSHKFLIDEAGAATVDRANPKLGFRWGVVDHSHGLNVDARLDFIVEERDPFEGDGWRTLDKFGAVADNIPKERLEEMAKRFGLNDEHPVDIDLGPHRPVRLIRVSARGRLWNPIDSVVIFKPLKTAETGDSRSFMVQYRPDWFGFRHEKPALIDMLRTVLEQGGRLEQWREYSRDVVARAPENAQTALTTEEVLGILDFDPAAVDYGASINDLLSAGARAAGLAADERKFASRAFKGVPRTSVNFVERNLELRMKARTAATLVPSGPALARSMSLALQSIQLRESLERVQAAVGLQAKAMRYLWHMEGEQDSPTHFSRFVKATREVVERAGSLRSRLAGELGISSFHGHKGKGGVTRSPVFVRLSRGPGGAQSALVVREILGDLVVYLEQMESRQRQMLAAAVSLQGLLTKPAKGPDGLVDGLTARLPEGLEVAIPTETIDIQPKEIADYVVEIVSHQGAAREVVIEEDATPPSGWHAQLTKTRIKLQPGEKQKIYYKLVAPYFATDPINVVTSLRVRWADETGAYLAPQFLTRLLIGERGVDPIPPQMADPAGDVLWVSPGSSNDLCLVPGQSVDYAVEVGHQGSQARGVSMRILTPPPDEWVTRIEPSELVRMSDGDHTTFHFRLSAPLYVNETRQSEIMLAIGYADEFENLERLVYRRVRITVDVPRSRPIINGGEVRTYYAPTGAETTLVMELGNVGSVDDTYDIFVEEKPKDWFIHLEKTYVHVPHRSPAVPFTFRVRPPLDGLTGETGKLRLKAVSTRRPEIHAFQDVTLALRGPMNIALQPADPQFLISPGTSGVIPFVAINVMEVPVVWNFRVSPRTTHPEWFAVEDAPVTLAPGEERFVNVNVAVPSDTPVDFRTPLVLMALDEHGGEVVSASVDLRVIPNYKLQIRAVWERVVRTPGMIIVPIEVHNMGSQEDIVGLLLGGKRKYWGRLTHTVLRLKPGQVYETRLTIRVPIEAQAGQDALLDVKAHSLKDSRARDVVQVDVFPELRARSNASTYGDKVRY